MDNYAGILIRVFLITAFNYFIFSCHVANTPDTTARRPVCGVTETVLPFASIHSCTVRNLLEMMEEYSFNYCLFTKKERAWFS